MSVRTDFWKGVPGGVDSDDSGRFIRRDSIFRRWVSDELGADFPAEPGRYHLYVSLGCPWANRTVTVRALKGLEEVVGLSVVDPIRDSNGWVRVAVDAEDRTLGFSVVIPTEGRVHELDGLFVEPDQMSCGVGRALVEDAATRAEPQGAEALEVTAGPAQRFYERVGFDLIGVAQTRFGPAVRLRRDLGR